MAKCVILAALMALASCGGKGGDIAHRAEKAATAACECKDFDCTKEQIKALNKMSIKDKDQVEKLAEDRHATYKAAQKRASECQDKLRNAQ